MSQVCTFFIASVVVLHARNLDFRYVGLPFVPSTLVYRIVTLCVA